MAQKKSFLQEQSETQKVLVQMPQGGVFDGAGFFSSAEIEGLDAAIRDAHRQRLRVYVTSTENAGVAHTLAKALFEHLQRDDQDVVIVVGEDRAAVWAADLDQAQIAEQIRQSSHARTQGTYAGTRALIEHIAAVHASQMSRRILFRSVGWLALLGAAAVAVLVWLGKRRTKVASYTRELNRVYDRMAAVGQLLEEVELEARFQPDNEQARRFIQTARERYLTATAQLEQTRADPGATPSAALPGLSRTLEEAQVGLEKARRVLQASSSSSHTQQLPAAPPPEMLGDRAFSPRQSRDDRQREGRGDTRP